MHLNKAIQHLKESLTDPTHKWGCEECKAEHEQLLEWLEDYKCLQSVNSWISCSVKKPEAYKSVLIVIKDNDRYTWINIGETDEDGNWMIGGEFWYSKSDTSITHWMPTPELPKEVHHDEN